MSAFEEFVFAFLAEYHIEYPRSLQAKQLTLETVLDHSSTQDVIREVITRHLRDVAYQRVDEWFKATERISKIGVPDEAAMNQIKEAKASRDVAVHNQGIANKEYVMRSGDRARFRAGEHVEISEGYLREVHGVVRATVDRMSDAAIEKLKG